MAFEKVQLPATITNMCCETGQVSVLYCTEVREDGVSILMGSETVEMVLENMDECLAKIAVAIARV